MDPTLPIPNRVLKRHSADNSLGIPLAKIGRGMNKGHFFFFCDIISPMAKNQKIYWWFAILIIALIAIYFLYCFTTTPPAPIDFATILTTIPEPITVNHSSGLYRQPLQLRFSLHHDLPSGINIHYTLDGTMPNWESPQVDPRMSLESTTSGTLVYPLTATLCDQFQHCSGQWQQTYVLGEHLDADLDIPLVSIATAPYNLYDYNAGIFVRGRTWDENTADQQGNYNQRSDDWVRPASVTMIQPSGEITWQQPIGIAVSGDTSASYEVKSLKLVAKKKVGYQPLEYTFTHTQNNLSEPKTYQSLRLRSGAQDIFNGNLRSSVASRLVQQTGFPGSSNTDRVLVYLNGQYYGIFELQQTFSDRFLAARYKLPDHNQVEIFKGSERDVMSQLGLQDLFTTDLNDPANRAQLEAIIDIDDYLNYFAINILLNNLDWPHKNFAMWRYSGPQDPRNPYTDGRYRFLFYDADFIYTQHEIFIGGSNLASSCDNTLSNLLYLLPRLQWSSFPFIVKSDHYRVQLQSRLEKLRNSTFTTENINNIIDEEAAKITRQQQLHSYPGWENDFYGGIAEMKSVVDKLDTYLTFERSLVDCNPVKTSYESATNSASIN